MPVLIVQGASDPFGMPPAGPNREIVTVPGNHSLTGDLGTARRGRHRLARAVLGDSLMPSRSRAGTIAP